MERKEWYQKSQSGEGVCVQSAEGKKVTTVPRCSGGRHFEDCIYFSQTLMGLGGVQQKQPGLTVLQMRFCQLQKHRDKCELTLLLYGHIYIPTLILNVGVVLPQGEKPLHSLPHTRFKQLWVTGYHTVRCSVGLWDKARWFNISPHLKWRISHSPLAVLFPLLNLCQHNCSSDPLWVTSGC